MAGPTPFVAILFPGNTYQVPAGKRAVFAACSRNPGATAVSSDFWILSIGGTQTCAFPTAKWEPYAPLTAGPGVLVGLTQAGSAMSSGNACSLVGHLYDAT